MSLDRGNFQPIADLMRAENLPKIAIDTFAHYYDQLVVGRTGMIPEADIQPIASLPDLETFPAQLAGVGRSALPQTILLKLNGGLGTGMGLNRAKSLLRVKEGLNFLDIIARQAIDCGIPLVLMDSFSTAEDSRVALARYPELQGSIPLDFLQHKVPKILQDDLVPVEWPADPDLIWCPPGHGDIYTALITSGMLEKLLARGYRYAFVSNADNLGAVIDESLLGYFVENGLPFMMEVADRTEADKKGGHLARRADGQFILRESAQCDPADAAAFQDYRLHKYFNTNNLWLNLPMLRDLMIERGNILGLAMIRNSKTVDPRDGTSPLVYQIETAMGAAIEAFKGAGAIRVPKTRFAPIKTCNDLLDVRSDNYILGRDFQVRANPQRKLGRAFIDLDPACYKFVDDLEARFPEGPPSLLACERLVIKGDVKFGKDVVLKGCVEIINESGNQRVIADGEVIAGG